MASISPEPSGIQASPQHPTGASANARSGTPTWAADASSYPGPAGSLHRAAAVQELFRRWPLVPSRELERVRRVLLQCQNIGPHSENGLSEPAQALLELVTTELERRRATGPPVPARPVEVDPYGRSL